MTAAIRDISVRKAGEYIRPRWRATAGCWKQSGDAMVVVNQGGEIVLLNAREKEFATAAMN